MKHEQLRVALGERLSRRLDLQTAALAGHLARICPGDPLLARVPRPTVSDLIQAASRALEQIEAVTKLDPPGAAWGALVAMQDAIAAAEHADALDTIAHLADEAAAAVRAFPEGWSPVAARAGLMLDPTTGCGATGTARRLWAAVEAAPAPWSTGDESREVPLGAAIAAGIAPEVTLRLAARDGTIAAPSWDVLTSTSEDVWVVTEDEQGPVLLFIAPTTPSVRLDGAEVATLPHPEGAYVRLRPGAWELVSA